MHSIENKKFSANPIVTIQVVLNFVFSIERSVTTGAVMSRHVA